MPEAPLVGLAILKLGVVFAFAICYALGGRASAWSHGKVFRRYIGSALLVGGVGTLAARASNFAPLMLVSLLAYPAALSLGYGSDNRWTQLTKRARAGLALGLAGGPIAWAVGAWGLWSLQVVCSIFVSVSLGVFNPARNAVDEETLIATGSTFMVPFYI